MTEQPFLLASDGPWTRVRDGNTTVSAIYDRHYSRGPASLGHLRVAGPGEKMVLLSPCARAIFVWRKFISKDNQVGINCAIFRNEGAGRSSDLIRSAMELAWSKWPGERFYTYVNPRRVRSANPGYCFLMAGWRRCGITKTRKLLVLEFVP